MGLVKFKDEVIYEGPLGQFEVNSNWCNSMGEYYPFINVYFVVNSEKIECSPIKVDGFFDPGQSRLFKVDIDSAQKWDMQRIRQARIEAEEAKTIRLHKVVTVVRGRKVPIGTEGEVFWMGDKGWGMSVGLRLLDGSKVFTAMKNVEIVSMDKAFEEILKG